MSAGGSDRDLAEVPATAWDKTDIIHFLSDRRGYRRYLEICTATTGNLFGKIDKARFDVCHRLMYRCSPEFNDGLNIDFRSPDMGADAMRAIQQTGERYDIILVDPFHTYSVSYRDLAVAFELLQDGGTMIVHDCFPPTADDGLISAEFTLGPWCGLTFMAFVDFAHSARPLRHLTVDTDYGCGVIWKSRSAAEADSSLLAQWREACGNGKAAFDLLHKHKETLLRLVSVEEFKARADALQDPV